jgi:hypothetical protein
MTGPQSEERPLNIRALLGLAFDGKPDETRVTRGEDFLLYGGSKQTHEMLFETTMRLKEKVVRRGKRLAEINARDWQEITDELQEEQ